MEKELFPSKYFYGFYFLFLIIFIVICQQTNGIGQGGDSVFHFLMAKFSWQHPHLFFNHWGKPFFTIIASVFAQFGFIWIKIFNTLNTFIGIYYGYKLAKHFEVKNAGLVLFLVILAPLSISVNFSGLTEPMFASVLLASLFFIADSKEIKGAFLISFLPFVRSEGLIILVALAVYFLLKQNWKVILMLSAGHIIMSIAGMWVHDDILWVFTKIPYAHLNPVYGKGTWDHFLIQMNFMIGPILYGLFSIGLISVLLKHQIKVFINVFTEPKLFLIYGIFIAFFCAHTTFWALGIFGSMGLTRVFAGVMPLIAIIAIEGFNFIGDLISKKSIQVAKWTSIVVIILSFVFPFLDNPASYDLKKDLYLSDGESLLKDSVCEEIKMNFPNKMVVASDACVPLFLNIDPFDSAFYQTSKNFEQLTAENKKFILIWDPWFSAVEDNISSEKIESDTSFKLSKFYQSELQNKKNEYRIYTNN